MQQPIRISEFLKTVCEQVRWKKAHNIISEELENHITDQKDAYIAAGIDEEKAMTKAIKEMGDPVLIGSELDRTHQPKIEWSVVLLTGLVLLIGFAIRRVIAFDLDLAWLGRNSIISAILGLGFMVLVYHLDFTILGRYPKAIYFALLVLTIGTIAFSPAVNGRYFYAQFILLLFPTAFAGILYNMRTKGYLGIILSGIFLAVPAFIGLVAAGFPIVVVYSLACLILLTFAIANGWFNVKRVYGMLLFYIPTIITTMIVGMVTIVNNPYRLRRLNSFFDPSFDPLGAGYIGTITREMLAKARFLGRGQFGIDQGMMLPNASTDFVVTYLIHRVGWMPVIVLMALLLSFIVRSLVLCSGQKSVLGKLVSASVLITFTMQIVLYVAFNLGFQLVSPLTLPMISHSGTATVINMILIGVMLSVFKSGDLFRDNLAMPTRERKKLLEIIDGRRIIG